MNIELNDNYKFLIVFSALFLIILAYFSLTSTSIHTHFNLRILITILMFVTGFFVLYKSDLELHNKALMVLLVFGLIIVILNPIMLVPDEAEHYARSELVSNGELIPVFHEGKGYSIHENIFQLSFSRNLTFLDDTPAFDPISNNLTFYHSCFSQNPFYGYLLSGLGVFLSKILDLSVIWSLWLGRLFNLIFYVIVCVYSIRRSPSYKMPLFVVSALPLALSQGASFSIDFLIISLMVLACSSIIIMSKSKVEYKELFLFFFLILLVGLIKVPYVLFAFLIFIVPRENFKDNSSYLVSCVLPFIVLVVCSVWSLTFASGQLAYSYRGDYFITNNINSSAQLNYLISNPSGALSLLGGLFLGLPGVCIGFFKFYHGIWIESILPIAILYSLFFIFFSFLYPIDFKLSKKARFVVFVIVALIFVGINVVQYLSWTPVGLDYVDGMQSRYFIPLLLFLPMLFNLNKSDKIGLSSVKIDLLLLTTILIALTSFVYMFTFTYY